MAAAAGMGLGPSGRGSSRTKGLDCPICFEAYGSSSHVPMVLSCGHTLCEECVEKNRRGADKVLCPFDTSLWTVTKNFALLQILELEMRTGVAPAQPAGGIKSGAGAAPDAAGAGMKLCDICCGDDGEPTLHEASVYCVDCEQYMCDQAARLHGRTRATREHAIVPMEDVEFRQSKPIPQCPFHHMPIEYLCLEDDCLVCVKCLPCPIHNGHRCKAIPEALADENRMISADLIQEGRGKIEEVSRALKVAEETIDGVDERQRAVKDQINAYVDELERVLQAQRRELLKHVDETTTLKLKILSAQAEGLRTILEALVNGVDHLERHDTNEARDLVMKRAFRKSVENTKVSLEPDALNDLEFVPREAVPELLLGSLGEVTESGPCAFTTTASGPGVLAYQLQAQRGMRFTVTTKSRQSQAVARGGEKVSLRIDEALGPDWSVEDHADGAYTVEYRLRAEAVREQRAFRLFVRLNDKDIQGSPFQVPIRKDFNYVVDRSLQGIGLVSGGLVDGDFVYVALYSQNQVVKVRRDTGAQEQRIPVNGQPYGMAVDGDLLYVCLYNTHYVGVYHKDTGAQERMLGGPGVFTNPVGLAHDGGELLYVSEHLGHRVQVVRKESGATVQRLEDATLRSPFGILLDEQHIYVSSNTGNHIKVYAKDGLALVRTVGDGGGQFLQSPISLAQEEDVLFVGCNGNNIVQLYRKGSFEALGTIHNVNQPYGACVADSFLYMCCMGVSAVTVFRPSYLDPSPHASAPQPQPTSAPQAQGQGQGPPQPQGALAALGAAVGAGTGAGAGGNGDAGLPGTVRNGNAPALGAGAGAGARAINLGPGIGGGVGAGAGTAQQQQQQQGAQGAGNATTNAGANAGALPGEAANTTLTSDLAEYADY